MRNTTGTDEVTAQMTYRGQQLSGDNCCSYNDRENYVCRLNSIHVIWWPGLHD